tara:strand:- start:2904 stop:3590 length:687 start_codon:yes stop_codon:yes gene_type:complete
MLVYNTPLNIPQIRSIDLTRINVLENNNYNMKEQIKKTKKWSKIELILMRIIYHNIYDMYWWLSISILVLSSLLTVIESTKLLLLETKLSPFMTLHNNSDGNDNDDIILSKGGRSFNFTCDIIALIIGISITILTSYIRFNKYQSKLEQVSNRIEKIITFENTIRTIDYKINSKNLDNNELNNYKDEIIKLEELISTDGDVKKLISEKKEKKIRDEINKKYIDEVSII